MKFFTILALTGAAVVSAIPTDPWGNLKCPPAETKIEYKTVTEVKPEKQIEYQTKYETKYETVTQVKEVPKVEYKTETKEITKVEYKTETKEVPKIEYKTETKEITKVGMCILPTISSYLPNWLQNTRPSTRPRRSR